MKRTDIQLTTMDLIHYGSDKYDPGEFKPIHDDPALRWIKPKGGLWTSPANSEHGWRWWCEGEGFHTEALRKSFTLRYSGRLYVIHTQMDLYGIPESITHRGDWVPLWEKLMDRGYDAVHLTWEGQCGTRFSHPKSLYGWDCETVLVMDPRSIVPLYVPILQTA